MFSLNFCCFLESAGREDSTAYPPANLEGPMRGVLLLEDGRRFTGEGFGSAVTKVGEAVFNTAMTGYQEVLTDPSPLGAGGCDDRFAHREYRRQ